MKFELNQTLEWSLSKKARAAIQTLKETHGFDPDFALEVLTQLWPEEAIFDGLSSDSDNEQTDA